MSTLLHGESRRMYSWWWDSHISPKNSKWLQENLTDMDRNVKAMIKLIEEDADSFARRAEMYYKKRPELLKLIEEFYRAYRALAERYDHATGALRQAHRTMAEAFPNQILPITSDESPSSSGTEFGPHTPEMPSPMHAPLDLADLQKDVLGVSSNFHARRWKGAYSEESKSLSSKEGLKQLKEMFPSGEGLTHAKSEGKVRKVLNFEEEEGNANEKEDLKSEIKRLQGEVSQLTTRNENLMTQMASESQHARTLEETISKLEAMKEAALLQYKLSIEWMSSLEADICNTRDELDKVNNEMAVKLNSIEEQCLAMEKVNKSLRLELVNHQKELEKGDRELEELKTSLEAEEQKRMQAEVALMSLEQIHTHSQEEAELLVLEIQCGSEKLKEMELNKVGLEEKISELNEIIGNLHEQNISFDLKIKDLHDEMKLLKETKEELEHELGIYMEERKALQDELFCLKEDQRDLEQRNRGLTEQMEVVSEKNVVLENSLSDVNVELGGLRVTANALEASCETLLGEVSTHVVEKGVLVSQIEIISQNMERLSEKSTSLENSLSDAHAELEGLRARFKDMEECCMSLCNQNSIHLAEKNALVSQVENLGNKYLELQNQQLILEKERDSNVHQVMELQCSLTLEKQEHEVFLVSSSSQLASLHNQINLLEEQLCIKMDDFELEQQKVMNYLLEIFILKSCLHDVNDKNLFLFGECQNLLEASRCAKDQISQLKHTKLMQKEELTSLSECNGVLMKGIHLLLDALSIDVNQKTASDITEEVLVQIILVEVNNLLNSLSDTWEENRRVLLQVADTEAKCLILQDQLANLEKEKDSVVHQVMDLESSLRLEKRDHEALILSLSNQLASLQNQIHLLQEDIQVRDEELEVEQTNTLKAHLENLIFQRCLRDMKDNNMLLSGECRNLLEAHRCAEKQISDLEYKGLIQSEELNRLSNLSNNLWAGIHLLLEALNLDIEETIDDPADEAVLETISGEIRNLLGSISDAHNENQCLHLEILVLVTLFKQIGVDNFQLHQELESRNKELVALSSEKLKLMEMCKHLEDENNILVSKVVNFESKCLSLQDQLANLEKEKESTVHQVMDLESSLRLEKKEHEVLILSLSNQLASLQNRIHLLQEDIQVRDEELEVEQQNTIKALLENLILQRCLCDMKDNNLILSEECQNLLEAHRCAEKQISDLEYKGLIQNEELTLLSNLSNNLQAGVHLLLEALNLDGRKETMDDRTDEAVLETILGEIRNLRSSISDAHDENLCLHLQLLVHVTLFKQIRVDNFQLHQELESRTKKLVALSNEKLKLMETSKQLEDENNILVSKIETTGLSLEMLEVKHAELEDKNLNLEIKYAELEDKNLNLGREKDLSLHQILELENSLELEKEERHALISSSKNRIASLATQLDLLQEERQVKEDEFEREQQKASDALLENFILQRCLSDVNDRNLILSEECQRLLDASRCSDKLISEVQHECHIQQKEMKLISENNEKLRNGILLLLKEFNINMDCGTVDGTKGEVMLEALLDQIKAMLNSFSNVQEKSQSLCLEISVLGTLLKEIALEKVQLYYEIGSRNEEVLLLQEKKDEAMEENERLKVEMLSLVEQLSHVHASHQASQTEIHNLHEVNWSLSKGFYDLKEKMVALEEENNDILAEALTLDHLFIFFKAQDTERALKLKLLSDNICSILAVKNYLEEENRVQNERIRRLEVQTMDLNESAILQEFDLNMATNFCEEFYLQIEAAENLLLQKEMELAEAREESAELCRNLETVSKDLDGAVLMQRELKVEINTLSLGIVSKEGEITEILEANRFLHKELDRLNCEVEVLGIREEYLTTKLQKGINEVNKCEGEIQTLLDDIQLSTVNAAIFEEKLLEQIVACESIQTVSMLQREKLDEEIALKSACAYELKKELDNLKRENGTLMADLNAYSTLVMSLFDGVACVEELIFSLAKLQDKEVNGTSDAPECKKSGHQPSKNDSTLAKAGFLDLQKLIAKIEALQKVIIDFTNLLQQERLDSNAKIEAARKEIEELKLKEMLLHEKSKEKYGQIMKDIQLDQVSRSRVSSYSANKNENGEADDQMLELWETAERDDIEAVEEVKSEYPSSELIAEKELSIDKLELSTRVNESSAQVGNKRLNEKLDSDAQMLSVLQRSLQGLKTKVEKSEKKKHPKTSEYGTLKAQLREVEEAILELSDTNRKLKKKVEDNFESSNAVIWEKERRQVSEQARGGWSEKIAKLELELQKIDYIFLKVEEEEENLRTGFVDRKSSTLRDYLSGKKDGKGKRKSSFCGCMRPRTKA